MRACVVTIRRRPTGKARVSVAGGAVHWRATATAPLMVTSFAPARGCGPAAAQNNYNGRN